MMLRLLGQTVACWDVVLELLKGLDQIEVINCGGHIKTRGMAVDNTYALTLRNKKVFSFMCSFPLTAWLLLSTHAHAHML